MTNARARILLAAAGVSLLVASSASAIPLLTLVQQGLSIPHEDKVFSNFQVTITGKAPYFADPAQIDVVAFTAPNGDVGLRFQPLGTAGPIISASPNAFVDVLISFDVDVAFGPELIKDIGLKFNGLAPADGVAQVVETVSPAPQTLFLAQVEYPSPLEASLDLPGTYPHLNVIKDVLVWGGSQQGSNVLFIEQTFSQIPEPAALAMLALGSLMLLPRCRRARGPLLASAVSIAMLVGSAGNAHAVMLDQLVTNAGNPNGEIVYGDKVFSNFSANLQTIGQVAVALDAIDVAPITLGDEIGLRFAGAIAALSAMQPGSMVTLTIGFDVEVTDPAMWIHDITLRFNGARTGFGAFARVTEEVTNLDGGGLMGSALVENSDSTLQLVDHLDLNGLAKTVHVVKTITVDAGRDGLASISYIDQTFSQIPEPATAALLGLAGLFCMRRRVR